MDERVFPFKVGQPIPEWDLRHRLPINQPVGPECKDTATIFKINSTFMDVSDQPYMRRQWLSAAVLSACLGVGLCIDVAQSLYSLHRGISSGAMIYTWAIIFIASAGFSFLALKFGRDEFFSLKRRPIRFNRKEQKLYLIRRRRFFARQGAGDVTWEVPWNSQSIFCLHKGEGTSGEPYHIRHYAIDDAGNVVRAFSIGREWEGAGNIQGLLSQWNFWCEYMTNGPANLPKPPLYFCEHENMRESFLFCMYEFGFSAGSVFRSIIMPVILLSTCFRLLAQWTCRQPVWPASVEAASVMEPGDPFDQPKGDTPVGWGETALATARGAWPADPRRPVTNWQGEEDSRLNALLWASEAPPNVH